jgi:hypothetical protein
VTDGKEKVTVSSPIKFKREGRAGVRIAAVHFDIAVLTAHDRERERINIIDNTLCLLYIVSIKR